MTSALGLPAHRGRYKREPAKDERQSAIRRRIPWLFEYLQVCTASPSFCSNVRLVESEASKELIMKIRWPAQTGSYVLVLVLLVAACGDRSNEPPASVSKPLPQSVAPRSSTI